MVDAKFHNHVWVGESDFDVAKEYQALCNAAPHAGAVVFFVGLVRDFYSDQNEEQRVNRIELQHYAGMTERLCVEIIQQAHERFTLDGARVLHRVGKLSAGDQIVMVAVASRHRESAYQASQFIMDYLKTRATFWKREIGTRGSQWLGVKAQDQQAAQRWNETLGIEDNIKTNEQ